MALDTKATLAKHLDIKIEDLNTAIHQAGISTSGKRNVRISSGRREVVGLYDVAAVTAAVNAFKHNKVLLGAALKKTVASKQKSAPAVHSKRVGHGITARELAEAYGTSIENMLIRMRRFDVPEVGERIATGAHRALSMQFDKALATLVCESYKEFPKMVRHHRKEDIQRRVLANAPAPVESAEVVVEAAVEQDVRPVIVPDEIAPQKKTGLIGRILRAVRLA